MANEYPVQIYEMMARLGIEPSAAVLTRLSLRYATAFRRCVACQSKKVCQDWLDYAPAMVNFAPFFCSNAEILFELQHDCPGPRRVNWQERAPPDSLAGFVRTSEEAER